MNKLIPLVAFSILLLVPVSQNVFAGPAQNCFVLTFEGMPDGEDFVNYYNGGLGGSGTGPGPNFGVVFNSGPHALVDSDAGGTGNIANEPSPDTVLFHFNTPTIIMTLSQEQRSVSWFNVGFIGAVVQVSFFDSANNLLGMVTPTIPVIGVGGDPTGELDNWGSDSFDAGSNLIKRVEFVDSNGIALFDDIEICADEGQVIGGQIIPIESTSLILAGAQTFSWMIPVVLSVLGIGLFVFRKSKNS